MVHLLSCDWEVFRHLPAPRGGDVSHQELQLFLVRPVEGRPKLGQHGRRVQQIPETRASVAAHRMLNRLFVCMSVCLFVCYPVAGPHKQDNGTRVHPCDGNN